MIEYGLAVAAAVAVYLLIFQRPALRRAWSWLRAASPPAEVLGLLALLLVAAAALAAVMSLMWLLLSGQLR